MAKILLIEDDKQLTQMIVAWLSTESHLIEVLHDGLDGLDNLRASNYDLVVLDWELPRMSGVDILATFRDEGGSTPVLMLTGRRTIDDKATGLDRGADDYLTKPFHMKEFSARVRALLRRPVPFQANCLRVGNLTLEPGKHRVTKNGADIHLLPKEFALLEFFMRHPGDVFSPEALLQRVWHSETEATVEAIRTCIKRLRQKLDLGDKESVIETIARIGYRLRP